MDETTVLKLDTPIFIDNETVEEIPYDFDALTGRDLRNISKSLKMKGVGVTMAALDLDFQQAAFCKAACKVNSRLMEADIMRMSGRDTMRAAKLARDFLLASDPDAEDMEDL